jgi:hypothetical protein
MACVVALGLAGCHGGGATAVEGGQDQAARVAAPPTGAAATPHSVDPGATLQATGTAGGVAFDLACTGVAAKPGPGGHVLIACRDAKTGFEVTLDLVAPKVGRMDVSPNAGASVIRFSAGAAGVPDSTDGGSNAALDLSAWDTTSGKGAGTFMMDWFDSAPLKLRAGRLRGSFKL